MALSNKLLTVFQEVDTSSDHRIDWSELRQCCEKLQIQLDDTDKLVFHSCESDGMEGLDFPGFCNFFQVRLEKVFKELDSDRSGYIEHHEINTALQKLDIHLNSRQIDSILKGMDADGNNKIDFDEFCLFFADVPSPNFQAVAKRWSAGEGLDFGSDIVPTSMPPVEMPLFQFMCAGGLAGVASRTFTAPLEKIKILSQVQYFLLYI